MDVSCNMDSLFVPLSTEELVSIDGGLIIVIGAVTLVLTAKGMAMGIGAVAAAYAAGRAIGEGLAYILK